MRLVHADGVLLEPAGERAMNAYHISEEVTEEFELDLEELAAFAFPSAQVEESDDPADEIERDDTEEQDEEQIEEQADDDEDVED